VRAIAAFIADDVTTKNDQLRGSPLTSHQQFLTVQRMPRVLDATTFRLRNVGIVSVRCTRPGRAIRSRSLEVGHDPEERTSRHPRSSIDGWIGPPVRIRALVVAGEEQNATLDKLLQQQLKMNERRML
jgi:hypothetical protein